MAFPRFRTLFLRLLIGICKNVFLPILYPQNQQQFTGIAYRLCPSFQSFLFSLRLPQLKVLAVEIIICRLYSHSKDDEINEILRYRIIGRTIRQIAKNMKRSPTTITNVIQKRGFKVKEMRLLILTENTLS